MNQYFFVQKYLAGVIREEGVECTEWQNIGSLEDCERRAADSSALRWIGMI